MNRPQVEEWPSAGCPLGGWDPFRELVTAYTVATVRLPLMRHLIRALIFRAVHVMKMTKITHFSYLDTCEAFPLGYRVWHSLILLSLKFTEGTFFQTPFPYVGHFFLLSIACVTSRQVHLHISY